MATSRRQFLGLALGAGAELVAVRFGRSSPHPRERAAAAPRADLQEATRTAAALGTRVTISAFHGSRTMADRAVAAAFAEIELVEEILSLYRPGSQLSRLNREGCLRKPHPYLTRVLNFSLATSRRTAGAFDVTVQPLWELYRQAQRAGRIPSTAEIAEARKRVGWRSVVVRSDRIVLSRRGAAITLNGIAQGFAADRALAALRRHGIEHALVDAGELGALGTRSDGGAWVAGIQHPRRPDAWLELAALDGRCLATSADYATAFTPDLRHHHIFNPQTGDSPQELSSVSILARSGMEADALSTAVFVLGSERGSQLIARTPGVDALFVLKDGRTVQTRGFPSVPV